MKKHYMIPLAIAGTLALVAFRSGTSYKIERLQLKHSHAADSNGPSAGRTGAPGETNCTTCHSGTAQSGTGINSVIMTDAGTVVTSYTPGTVYNVAVTFTTSSSKNGFEIVALNSSNAQAGTIALIPSTGTQLKSGSAGKKYVTHTSAGNQLSAWAFQWTAPATNVGNVTFYLATNETNANNSDTGDIIRLSQHVFGSVAGIAENVSDMQLEVGYQSATNNLVVQYQALSSGESSVNLVDLSGKSVFSESIGTTEVGENKKAVKLPSDLKAGIYIVHLNVNNNFTSKKIYIQ
jgi:hypothetical protein